MSVKENKIPLSLNRFFIFWFRPIDVIRLSTFRVVMAMAIFFYLLYRWSVKEEWLTSAGFHVSAQNLPYHQFSVPLLPVEFLSWFGVLLFGSLIAVVCGWKLKWSSWVAWGCLFYVTMADQLASFVTNKLAVAALLIIALAEHGSYWSVERTKGPQRFQAAWPVRILQMTLIVNYFTAGWSKIVWGEWLKDPYVLWSQLQGTYMTDFAAWLLRTLPLWAWPLMQCSALAFEILAPFNFGIKSLRGIGLLWGVGFQLVIAATMHQLVYFSLVVLSFYVLFLDEKVLHRIHDFLTKKLRRGYARA